MATEDMLIETGGVWCAQNLPRTDTMTSVARKDPAETLVEGMGKWGPKLLNMIRREHHLQRVGAVTTLTLCMVGSDVGNTHTQLLCT